MRKITVAKGDGIFENQNEGDLPKSAIPKLMSKAIEEEVDVIKTENIKADFLELTIYSELKFDTIDTKSAILKYNNSLFMFHDLKKINSII